MKKIIVIQLYRLGDVLQSTAAVRALKKKYKGSIVDFVVDESCSVMLKGNRYINRVFKFKRKIIQSLLEKKDFANAAREVSLFAKNLSAYWYDLAINLTFEPLGGMLLDYVKAGEKRGLSYDGYKFKLLDPWTKYLFAASEGRKNNRINLVDIFRMISGCIDYPAKTYLKINEKAADRFFDFKENLPVTALQPAASKPYRALDPSEAVKLACLLANDFNVIFLGAKGEEHYASGLPEHPRIKNLMTLTTIEEMAAIIKKSDLLISPDTVTNHIAAAAGAKVLTYFYGSAFAAETAPYTDKVTVLSRLEECQPCNSPDNCKNSMVCKKGITPETIYEAACFILKNKKFDPPEGVVAFTPKFNNFMYFGEKTYEKIMRTAKEISLIYLGNIPKIDPERAMSDKKLGNAIKNLERDLILYRR